jgi:hypothetical protein
MARRGEIVQLDRRLEGLREGSHDQRRVGLTRVARHGAGGRALDGVVAQVHAGIM